MGGEPVGSPGLQVSRGAVGPTEGGQGHSWSSISQDKNLCPQMGLGVEGKVRKTFIAALEEERKRYSYHHMTFLKRLIL